MTSRAIILVLALAGTAAADPKVDAQKHIDAASKLHADGKLAGALQHLKEAYVLDPRPELLFAIGQIHVNLGQCADAITYYERFLATKPGRDEAAVTREAIRICKTNPPPAIVQPEPEPEPIKPPPPPAPTPPRTIETTRPWYTDVVGDALLGGGLVVGIAGGALYAIARSDRQKADDLSSFQQYSDALDKAAQKRDLAIVLGAAGGALVLGGVVRFVLHDRTSRSTMAIVPVAGGGAVTWTWRR